MPYIIINGLRMQEPVNMARPSDSNKKKESTLPVKKKQNQPLKKGQSSTKRSDKSAPQTKKTTREPAVPSRFPIVALGASAGGLEAFETFFTAMPPKSGIAFVLIAHLDPTYVSLLPELIQRHTQMVVAQMQDEMLVEPDHVYVTPPQQNADHSQRHPQFEGIRCATRTQSPDRFVLSRPGKRPGRT
jgi:chemotaxis response regulator CheB